MSYLVTWRKVSGQKEQQKRRLRDRAACGVFKEEEKGQCGRSNSGKEGRTGMWWERQSTGVLAKALRFRRTQIRDIPTAS